MNEEAYSLLSEKVSKSITCLYKNSITDPEILIEYPHQILSQYGKHSASTSKWNLQPQQALRVQQIRANLQLQDQWSCRIINLSKMSQ